MEDGKLCCERVAGCLKFNLPVECISISNDFATVKEQVNRGRKILELLTSFFRKERIHLLIRKNKQYHRSC